MNSHVSYLKSGLQCLGRKEFNAEKETILITAEVEKQQYIRRERGVCKQREETHRNPITKQRKREEAAPTGTKRTEAKI